MLSGNCQAGPLLAGTNTNMAQPDNFQTRYDSKTKILVLCSLSGSKFREELYPNNLKCVTPFISGRIHTAYTCMRITHCHLRRGNCQ